MLSMEFLLQILFACPKCWRVLGGLIGTACTGAVDCILAIDAQGRSCRGAPRYRGARAFVGCVAAGHYWAGLGYAGYCRSLRLVRGVVWAQAGALLRKKCPLGAGSWLLIKQQYL